MAYIIRKGIGLYIFLLILLTFGLQALPAEQYVLTEGDTISITVLDEPNLTGEFTIRLDGKISMSLIGEIQAAGLTTSQLTDKLKTALAEYVNNPQVSIQVTQYAPRKVYVLGQVTKPGIYGIQLGTPIMDIITLADGFATQADLKNVSLIHANGTITTLDFQGFPRKVSKEVLGVKLEPNDTIFVPTTPANSFYILGTVTKPGAYAFTSDITLLQALTMAGVIAGRADFKNATLIHADGTKSSVDFYKLFAKGDASQNVNLQAGDIIFIPEAVTGVSNVYLLGYVNKPGAYPIGETTTLLEVITMAGGLAPQGDPKAATLMRANGETSAIDFEKLLSKKDLTQNITLEPGDAIYVPENIKNIQILGAINRPGLYAFRAEIKIAEAIAQAGGTHERSRLNEIHIIRGNPEGPTKIVVNLEKYMKEGDITQNITLQAGDTVYVPELKRKTNTREIFSYVIGLATLLYYLKRY